MDNGIRFPTGMGITCQPEKVTLSLGAIAARDFQYLVSNFNIPIKGGCIFSDISTNQFVVVAPFFCFHHVF